MGMRVAVGLVFAAASFWSGVAMADQNCKDALVRSSLQYQHSHDYRLATLVTREVWEEQSKGGGVSATIYGVPISATYEEFHNKAESNLNALNQSESDALNVAWVGLDPNAREAYEACLRSQNDGRPHLSVVGADDTSVTLLATYIDPEHLNDPPIKVTWSPRLGPDMPATISQGIKFTVPRPQKKTDLSFNTPHQASETVELVPNPIDIDPLKVCNLSGGLPELTHVGMVAIGGYGEGEIKLSPEPQPDPAHPLHVTYLAVRLASDHPDTSIDFGYDNGAGIQAGVYLNGSNNCVSQTMNPNNGQYIAFRFHTEVGAGKALIDVWREN